MKSYLINIYKMTVHKIGGISVVLMILTVMFSCEPDPKISAAALIPLPEKVHEAEGAFEINKSTKIHVAQDAGEMRGVADFLATLLNQSTGYNIQVVDELPESGNYISLGQEGSGEAYKLHVQDDHIQVKAGSAYPPSSESREVAFSQWSQSGGL